MLPLDSRPTASAHPARRTSQHRFGFGGVAFELLLDAAVPFALPAVYERHMVAPAYAPTVADVVCCVRLDPGLPAAPELSEIAHGVLWEPALDDAREGLNVRSREVALSICRTSPRHYAVAARVGSSGDVPRMLLLLAATVTELAGGATLHATAVEHAGRALLLLGPSGAGKTTASQLLGDVACLAHDRVCVVSGPDDPSSLWVWALPGGSPPLLPRSAHVALPLSALLRVQQAERSAVQALHGAQAVLYVREGMEVAVNSGAFEAQRLQTASQLALAAVSGVAHVALGQSWRAELEQFLRAAGQPLPPAGARV